MLPVFFERALGDLEWEAVIPRCRERLLRTLNRKPLSFLFFCGEMFEAFIVVNGRVSLLSPKFGTEAAQSCHVRQRKEIWNQVLNIFPKRNSIEGKLCRTQMYIHITI